jgi:hypothetical protein
VALVDSAFGQEPLQHPVQAEAPPPPQAGENLTSTFLAAARPYSCRLRASAKPKKGQQGKNDDNHTNDPEDIVHSCLPSTCEVVPLDPHIIDGLPAQPRPIIGQAAPNALIGPDTTVLAVRPAH